MIGIFTLLCTLALSLIITRVATVALQLTGLSREVARFQARSAFSGAGFTTNESEKVVSHPVRRQIIMILMLFGNLGIAAVVASTIFSFGSVDAEFGVVNTWMWRLAALSGGILVLWLAARSQYLDRSMSYVIEWALLKWTRIDVCDYVALLHLSEGFVVMELEVSPGDWIAERNLAESRLAREGVLVLGIHRKNGRYVGSPNGQTVVQEGDILSLYGPIDRLEELDLRKQGVDGDRAHNIAVSAQIQAQSDQDDAPQPGDSEEVTSS